jgi:hypothetical protein
MTVWNNQQKSNFPVPERFLLIDDLAHFLNIDDAGNSLLIEFSLGTQWTNQQKSSPVE